LNESPFSVPFIRWADTVSVAKGAVGACERQLYDHEFVYILEGTGAIILDGKRYVAHPDFLFLVPPRVWHSFLSPVEPQRLLGVHFDWRYRNDTANFQSFRPAVAPVDVSLFREQERVLNWERERPYLDLRGRPRVRKMLETVVNEYGRGDLESREIAGALLAGAIGHMAREARLANELSQNLQIGADAVRRVQRAREILEAPREGALSIEEVAKSIGWSSDHLRRMMKAVLNSTPSELQTAARIRRAQEFLRYGTLPIAEIARRCGFDDASHFTRVFKRETGSLPREWAGLIHQYRSTDN
jgi:AraC-like DNA-binding protein